MRAYVFPGQGSQAVGMLADVATQYPVVEETFAQASGSRLRFVEVGASWTGRATQRNAAHATGAVSRQCGVVPRVRAGRCASARNDGWAQLRGIFRIGLCWCLSF